MLPDLITATQDYWRKLDKIENDYQQGKISLAEVDAKVIVLMKELGEKRRKTLAIFWQTLKSWFNQQQELLWGLTGLGILSYFWLVIEAG